MFVSLLGSPEIQVDQRPLEALRRKDRALVYYLAAHGAPLRRDQVLALFWPDTPRPSAQQILRTMLHDLRQLGPNFLRIEEDRLWLGPDVQVDATSFKAGLAAPQPQPAGLTALLELYRGDFLDGFTLADTPAFDDWAAQERETYRNLAVDGWAALSRLYEAERNHAAALAALGRALALDPLREDLERDCLRLHYLNGDRAGAVRRYEALCRLLDEEMGVPPMPETRTLYEAIINDRLPAADAEAPWAGARRAEAVRPGMPAAGRPAAPLLQFTGRAGELEALKTLGRSGKLALVEGAAGIGKTRLVEEYLAGLLKASRQEGGAGLLLRGTSHELEQGLPYPPVVDALRGLFIQPDWPAVRAQLNLGPVWLAEIVRLTPELRAQMPDVPQAPESTDEARLWEGVSQFLQGLGRRRKVILFLDDLHWADPSTLGLVGYLVRRAASPAIVMIGAARSVEPRSRLAQLVKALTREDRLARLPLAALSPDDTAAVARQLSPENPLPLARWLAESAEGNPYFLTELVRHALSTNVLQKDGDLDADRLSTYQILPPTIQNLIQSRLMALSEEARRALDVAAVIGREFDFELVHRALAQGQAGPSEGATLDALDELQAAYLIRPRGGDSFSFDHTLTMEVALQDMGEARTRFLHRQLAQTLERAAPERVEAMAGLIAHHFARGNAPEQAGPYAWRAGRHAAGLAAWVEAIAFYEQALETQADPVRRMEILTAMGTARFHKGDFARATQDLYAAIELGRGRSDLPALEAAYMALTLSLLPQLRFAEVIALGRELVQSGPPVLALCGQFIWGTGLSVESATPVEAEAHLRQAEKLLDENPHSSSQITRTHIRYQLASTVGQQGRSAQAVALYLEALETVRQDETSLDLLRQIMLYNNLGYHLHLLGDEAAAGYVQAGIKLARERGSLSHMPHLLSTSGEIALAHGRLDEAEGYFSEGLRLAEQIPLPERVAGLTANLALVDRRRGRDEQARQRLEQALDLADRLGNRHLAVRIRLWLAPLLSPAEGRARLQEARQIAAQSGFNNLLEEVDRLEHENPPG